MPRGLDPAITDELGNTTFDLPIYAVRITRKGGAPIVRWAERPLADGTAGSFEPRLMSVSGMVFSADQAGPITIVAANVDGAVTILDRDVTFRSALVEVMAYLPAVGTFYNIWIGRADEVSEITQENATVIAYPSTIIPNVQIPKRQISLACSNTFGNFASWVSVRDFEGSECPYQRVPTIGFAATLFGAVDANMTAMTISWTAAQVAAGALFRQGDRLKIDNEQMLIMNMPAAPNNTQTLTITRGERDTIPAAHAISSTVFYNNCGFAVADCTRRGMYGNNTDDVYFV